MQGASIHLSLEVQDINYTQWRPFWTSTQGTQCTGDLENREKGFFLVEFRFWFLCGADAVQSKQTTLRNRGVTFPVLNKSSV